MRVLISGISVISTIIFVLIRLGVIEVTNKNGVVTAKVNWNS